MHNQFIFSIVAYTSTPIKKGNVWVGKIESIKVSKKLEDK